MESIRADTLFRQSEKKQVIFLGYSECRNRCKFILAGLGAYAEMWAS